MAKQIARLLKTDVMADIDIPAIAQFLQSQGRRGDTILAHINAKEAEILKTFRTWLPIFKKRSFPK